MTAEGLQHVLKRAWDIDVEISRDDKEEADEDDDDMISPVRVLCFTLPLDGLCCSMLY